MGQGRVSNEQQSRDAKLCRAYSQNIDLSTATVGRCVLYDPDRDLVIDHINGIYTTEAAAAASTVKFGTVADDDAFVSEDTGASASVGDKKSFTLLSTLASTVNDDSRGKPVLPKNTPMILATSASGGAGEMVFEIGYWPVDTDSTK